MPNRPQRNRHCIALAPHPTTRQDPRHSIPAAPTQHAARARRAGLLLAVTAVVLCLAGADEPVSENAPAGAGTAGTRDLEPFTQPIADTALSFEMLPVPGGTVTIQTPDGPETVNVAPFWILPTEVTWELYDTYHLRMDRRRSMESTLADGVTRPSNPYAPPDRGFGHAGYAALSMTHMAAETFCTWLGYKTGKTYRLPTEAQWQWACQLGSIEADARDDHAWHKANAENKTHPVASKSPNALGVYDMLGNVTEWCTSLDGEPVTCGGSYIDPPETLHCTARFPQTPAWNESDPQFPKSRWWLADASWVGFRFVCIPIEEQE